MNKRHCSETCKGCNVLMVMMVLIRQHVAVRRLPPMMQVYAIAAGLCTQVVKYNQLLDAARRLAKQGHTDPKRVKHGH